MKFIEQYNQFKNIYNPEDDLIPIPGSKTVIRNLKFTSSVNLRDTGYENFINRKDPEIKENNCFRYPVFVPAASSKSNRSILYLHGLNERNWLKHLTSAQYLAESTGRTVIMFPLSFHINRGLPEWSDTHKMAKLTEKRKRTFPHILDSSFVNHALSSRLTECPQRFFLSGYQSAMDVVDLLRQIKTGAHPLFEKDTNTDIFAYSISCMMLQCMMIDNPDDILNNSRFVFFAGGSFLTFMNGVSKFIMDSAAFSSIRRFYVDAMEGEIKSNRKKYAVLKDHAIGMGFRSMITPERFKRTREKRLGKFHERMMIIALRNDKVIPLQGICSVMGEKFSDSKHMKVLHFNYPYSHENPFPVLYNKIEDAVADAFKSVFSQAVAFFSGEEN